MIFADEPSGNLDSKNREELHSLLFNLRDTFKKTFVIVTHDENFAAICTERAGKLNGLTIAAKDIQDNPNNATRFFEISYRPRDAAPIKTFDGDKVLIICQIDGSRAGSLCSVLEEFSKRGVNMTRIESRPARTILGAYIFFFGLETDAGSNALRESIRAVYDKSIWLKNLGVFPVIYA